MKVSFLSLAAASVALTISGATLFQDGFEEGAGAAWQFSSTGNGRARVVSEYQPFAGSKHLVLDDSVDDAQYSSAEATLTLNLASRKNVVLSFRARNIGNEPHNPPQDLRNRNFDGVSVSSDGGTTWRLVQSLATVPTTWQLFTVTLDQAVTVAPFVSSYKIRFSAYDNAAAPLDGIAIDQVAVTGDVDQRAVLELPPLVDEGGGPYNGVALVAIPPESPLTLTLQSVPQGQLLAPTTITVPAGETSVQFQFRAADDSLLNFSRTASLVVTGSGIVPSTTALTVVDNEVATLTLTLPARVVEGGAAATGKVSIDKAATAPLAVRLVASPQDEIIVPETINIPAGAREISFQVSARNDERIDGSVEVTVIASATGLTSATDTVMADDNESKDVVVVLPDFISESGSAVASVRLSGTMATPVTVTLQGQGPITIPASVTVPAGALSADFTISGVDNTARDGSRNGAVTVAANAFTGMTGAVTIRDDEKAGFRFTESPDLAVIGGSATFAVAAVDIEGNVIEGASGNSDINLQAVLPDGALVAVTPSSVTLANGVWRGSVTVPNVGDAPLRLRASDSSGNTSDSAPFDLLRQVALQVADLAWDAKRNRIYASIPASATSRANTVVALDPKTGEIIGSVAVTPDPRQLAITSGQEYLYVALEGNGSIARINLDTFKVNSTFEIGNSTFYGPLYAEDITTVEGKPNLIVVSRYRRSVSPRHGGVAVFDNGVQLPDTTQDHTGSNIIEPSADPNIFFGYNTETTEFGFRRLQLDANGIKEIQVVSGLFGGFGAGMKSDGDHVVGTGGSLIDGAQMRSLGNFGTSGVPYPDFDINRVFFLEPTSWFSNDYKISAYDPITFTRIRQLTIPGQYPSAASLIRWGGNGLAFRSDQGVTIIYSGLLVPSEDPADLGVSIAIAPNPATVGQALTYTITATNAGPNAAANVIASIKLSESQSIQNATATAGSAAISSNTVTVTIPSLAANTASTITIVATSQSAGGVSAQAGVTSTALDPVSSNNTAVKVGSVGFESGLDTVNYLRLPANAMSYDATRGVLWVSIPAADQGPLARTVLSVNPSTGLVSDPISFTGNPSTLAVSKNGKYLYIGLTDASEVQRINLETRQPDLRIPLGSDGFLGGYYAEDIEPLDGDGTSIVVSRRNSGYSPRHEGVAVYDGATKRPDETQGHTGSNRIEATASPNLFIGYNNETTEFGLRTLEVNSTGIREARVVGNVIGGFSQEIRSGRSDLLLSSAGNLVHGPTLTLRANLSVNGFPAMDAPNNRAFMLMQNQIRAYDTTTYGFVGALPLSSPAYDGQALEFIRWGADGFAILSASGRIAIVRWSLPFPNAVGPTLAVQEVIANGGLKLVATEQVVAGAAAFKVFGSSDLRNWTQLAADECQITIVDSYSENGVQFQTVQYSVPTGAIGLRFFRLGR